MRRTTVPFGIEWSGPKSARPGMMLEMTLAETGSDAKTKLANVK